MNDFIMCECLKKQWEMGNGREGMIVILLF